MLSFCHCPRLGGDTARSRLTRPSDVFSAVPAIQRYRTIGGSLPPVDVLATAQIESRAVPVDRNFLIGAAAPRTLLEGLCAHDPSGIADSMLVKEEPSAFAKEDGLFDASTPDLCPPSSPDAGLDLVGAHFLLTNRVGNEDPAELLSQGREDWAGCAVGWDKDVCVERRAWESRPREQGPCSRTSHRAGKHYSVAEKIATRTHTLLDRLCAQQPCIEEEDSGSQTLLEGSGTPRELVEGLCTLGLPQGLLQAVLASDRSATVPVDWASAVPRSAALPVAVADGLYTQCSPRSDGKLAGRNSARKDSRDALYSASITAGIADEGLGGHWSLHTSGGSLSFSSYCGLTAEGSLLRAASVLCELHLHGLEGAFFAGASLEKLRASGSSTDDLVQVLLVEPDLSGCCRGPQRVWHVVMDGLRGHALDVVSVVADVGLAESVVVTVRSFFSGAPPLGAGSLASPDLAVTYRLVRPPGMSSDSFRLEVSAESRIPSDTSSLLQWAKGIALNLESYVQTLRKFLVDPTKELADCIEGSPRSVFYAEIRHYLCRSKPR